MSVIYALPLVAVLLVTYPVCARDLVQDSSTVRVNYYKNLYLNEGSSDCHSLALLASLDASTCSNRSDSAAVLVNQNCSAGSGSATHQIRPLITSRSGNKKSVLRSKSRNLTLDNISNNSHELTISLENVTALHETQETHSVKAEEEGKFPLNNVMTMLNSVLLY